MDGDASFGYWVRRRRKALDLTQDALARQVGCAETTIRKIEADARRPSRQTAERLAECLAIPIAERADFLRAARAKLAADRLVDPTLDANGRTADFPPPRTLDRWRHNLPAQPTTLIGRTKEIAAVRDLLLRTDVRLVTLTGPGGTGKTRLALQAAAELLDNFADGVYVVMLEPISDPALVAPTIAQTLGVKERAGQAPLERLKAHLRDRRLLLLLDNFEQILAAAPIVAELLAAAPELKVLITSRALLHLYGEHEFAVPPLAVPDLNELPPLDALAQFAAVDLFVQRARAVKLDFALTHANAPAIAEICARLDGLPLAIELAAARTKLFTPEALLARLRNRLALLTGGARDLPARQQTLRGTLDWSYNLLDASEQRLFRRLGVFVGGCTLEAAAAVMSSELRAVSDDLYNSELDILDGLASLLDKSLLRQNEGPDDEPRFVMLETIREYALERLAESGEEETVRNQHAAYYFALAHEAERHLRGAEQVRWLGRLALEHDNLRAALAWSQAHTGAADAENLLVQEQIADVYYLLGERSKAVPIYQEALDRWYRRADLPPLLEARLHYKIIQTIYEMKYRSDFAAWDALAQTQAAFRGRREVLLQRLAGVAPQPEQVRLLIALAHDAVELAQPPDVSAAERYAQAAVAIAEQLDQPATLSVALAALDNAYFRRGLLRERVAVMLRRLALSHDPRLIDPREQLEILEGAGEAQQSVGDYAQALVHLHAAVHLAEEQRATMRQMELLSVQAICLLRLDRWDDILKIETQRQGLEQRYSPEQLGTTCVIDAIVGAVYALQGESTTAAVRRQQSYDTMVDLTGPVERWVRGQHF
jgi:predicted ATPase/DNA-binding XRE family transcriptional regulator